MNLFELLRAAAAGRPLTPAQRALLKTLQSLLIGALVAGLLAAAQALSQPGAIDWQKLGVVAISALLFSLAHGIAKFISAQGDLYQALGDATERVISEFEQRVKEQQSTQPRLPTTPPKEPPGKAELP